MSRPDITGSNKLGFPAHAPHPHCTASSARCRLRDGDLMGIDDDTAARLLADLHHHFRTHPVTGLQEGRRATSVTAPAPLSIATLDHIQASVAEVVELTRDMNPAASPLPPRVEAVYDWCRYNTRHADSVQEQRRETVIYRQRLEHAIRAGDHKVIRPHRCPACRTFGLMWVPAAQRAMCTNTGCARKDGTSNSFSLSRLAYEHVAARYRLARVNAT